jgi:hypothetical protein
MKRLLLSTSIAVLFIQPINVQSQAGSDSPFIFQDIYLGMSIAEFRTKHPAPKVEKYGSPASTLPGQSTCGTRQKSEVEANGIESCYYGETYQDIALRISTMFVDGKLALIEVEPPADTYDCFELPPGSRPCPQFLALWTFLTNKLGPAAVIPVDAEHAADRPHLAALHAVRWENDVSVAEFQNHTCGPWNGHQGWSKAISEVLGRRYCVSGDSLDYRQNMMLYLDKALSRTLADRLGTAVD